MPDDVLMVEVPRPTSEEIEVLRMLTSGDQPPSTRHLIRMVEWGYLGWEPRPVGQFTNGPARRMVTTLGKLVLAAIDKAAAG